MKKLTTSCHLADGTDGGASPGRYPYRGHRLQIRRQLHGGGAQGHRERKRQPTRVELLMNDSQNDQSKQNDQIDVLLAKGVKAPAINLVDPAAAPCRDRESPCGRDPRGSTTRNRARPTWPAMTRPTTWAPTQRVRHHPGPADRQALESQPAWDLNKDGVIQFVLLKGVSLGHPDAGSPHHLRRQDPERWRHQDRAAAWIPVCGIPPWPKDKMDAWISGPQRQQDRSGHRQQRRHGDGRCESLKAQGKTAIPVFGVDAPAGSPGHGQERCHGGTVLNDAANQAKATFELTKNLAEGKPAGEGTNWKIDNKVVRVAYVGVDKDNLSQFE